MTDEKTPMEKFNEALGKIASVTKKELDEALEKAKETIEPSDAEPE